MDQVEIFKIGMRHLAVADNWIWVNLFDVFERAHLFSNEILSGIEPDGVSLTFSL